MTTRFDNLSEETRDQLAGIALSIGNNKETRPAFLKLMKQVAPDTPIPELDTAAAVEAALSKEREERSKWMQEQRDKELQRELSETKRKVMDKYQFSDEDMKKMEERMGKKELPADYEWAARIHQQDTALAAPTNYGHSGYGPVGIQEYADSMKGLMDDPDNWAGATAHQMIDDMQRRGAAKQW